MSGLVESKMSATVGASIQCPSERRVFFEPGSGHKCSMCATEEYR